MFSPPNYSSSQNFLNPKLGPWTFGLYLHRKGILNSLLRSVPVLQGKLLDVGCGNKPYRSLIQCEEYTGADVSISLHNAGQFDVVFDGMHLPFGNDTFDSIICTEVLEHCQDPQFLMGEIQRVLKKGGHAFITAPMFIEHHEVPYDMRRLTYYGMRSLSESNGMNVEWIDDRGSIFSVFIATIYLIISQFISRRPFSDIVYWVLFPFAYVLYRMDRLKKKNPPIVSLGWQMLIRKKQV